MVRTVKPPEERRREILVAALQLFRAKGYERTAVSDIVRAVGVAQGTFYYHFRSKSEVLDAVVDHLTVALGARVAKLAQGQGSPPERVGAVLDVIFDHIGSSQELIAFLQKPGNEMLHARVGRLLTQRLRPPLLALVQAGTASGDFSMEHPEATVDVLLAMLAQLTHTSGRDATPERLVALSQASRAAFLRTLGTERSQP